MLHCPSVWAWELKRPDGVHWWLNHRSCCSSTASFCLWLSLVHSADLRTGKNMLRFQHVPYSSCFISRRLQWYPFSSHLVYILEEPMKITSHNSRFQNVTVYWLVLPTWHNVESFGKTQSDCPVGKFLGAFLDEWLMWESPTHGGWYHPCTGGPGVYKKAYEQVMGSKLVNSGLLRQEL